MHNKKIISTYVEEIPSGTLGVGAFLVRGRPLSKMSSRRSSSSLSSDSNKLGKGKLAALILIFIVGTPPEVKKVSYSYYEQLSLLLELFTM